MQKLSSSDKPQDWQSVPMWIAPLSELGLATRLMSSVLSPSAYKGMTFYQFRQHCAWMGSGSLPMVCICSILISIALTTQVVLEAERFRAQDISGALIAVGLMREFAGLTVSLAWCAKVAAYISTEARLTIMEEGRQVDGSFFLPRYLAALVSGSTLAAFGLVIGFISAALYAPTLGVTSTADFLESARIAIKNKDIVDYALKLGLINPTIGVLAGCVCGSETDRPPFMSAANAVALTYMVGVAANLVVTLAIYLP